MENSYNPRAMCYDRFKNVIVVDQNNHMWIYMYWTAMGGLSRVSCHVITALNTRML